MLLRSWTGVSMLRSSLAWSQPPRANAEADHFALDSLQCRQSLSAQMSGVWGTLSMQSMHVLLSSLICMCRMHSQDPAGAPVTDWAKWTVTYRR